MFLFGEELLTVRILRFMSMDAAREHQTFSQARGPKKRTGTSKYDFFKVKVWLGENMDHYYILSRFLICRMLTVTKIPYIKAVKIALETKKYLVDNNLTDITQAQLEEVLFSIIRSKGFDEQYIDCYRMVTQFYQSRQPLCIIICGTAWTGKSSIAQQLASRINIPNVMQTDVIYELLRAGADSPLARQPLWCRAGLVDRVLVGEFRREAGVVRKGMEGDLIKTLSDGKPIIIEGMHLDPGLYIHDFGQQGIIMLPARPTTAVQLTRSPRSAPLGVDLASRVLYKRSLTAVACSHLGAGSPVCLAEAEVLGTQAVAADGGRQFGRCVSADAELSVLETRASALLSRRGHPRPLSAGLCGRTGTASGPGEELSAVTEVGASVPAAALDEFKPIQHQQSWTCEPVTGSGVVSSTDTCAAATATASEAPEAPEAPEALAATATRQQQQDLVMAFTAPADRYNTFIPVNSNISPVSRDSVHGPNKSLTIKAAESLAGRLSLSVADSHIAVHTAAESIASAAGSRFTRNSPSGDLTAAPIVIMLDQLQVCAATAEAVALQQQALLLEHQRQLDASLRSRPVSPLSDSTAPADPFTCISQEHSTTEVISRQPSLNSPNSTLTSQEPSAAEVIGGSDCSTTAVSLQQAHATARGESGGNVSGLQDQKLEQQWHLQSNPPARAARDGNHMLLEAGEPQPDPNVQSQNQQVPVLAEIAGGNSSTASTSPVVAYTTAFRQELMTVSNAISSGTAPTHQQGSTLQTSAHLQHRTPVISALETQQSQPVLTATNQAAAQSRTRRLQAVATQLADGCSSQHTAATISSKSSVCGHQQLDKKGPVHKPLFVPVLVYMDEADHVLMQEEALSHLGVSGSRNPALETAADVSLGKHGLAGSRASNAAHETPGGVDAGGEAAGSPSNGTSGSLEAPGKLQAAVGSREALRRMRLLQEYLCAYEAQGLPVVKVSYGNFGEALDKLHEYILQCIKVAMQL